MQKVPNGDQHPLRTIISESLGHDVHEGLILPLWTTRTLFSPTLVTSYPRAVKYIVAEGAGTLSFYDAAGEPAGIRVIESGPTGTGTIAAETPHSYAPTPGTSMQIKENNKDLVEQEAPDLD